MKNPCKSFRRSHHLLFALSIVFLLVLFLLAGGILYVTMARPDIGYGLRDSLFGRREPLALAEIRVEDTAMEPVPLAEIQEGKREGIRYQNSLWLVNTAHTLASDAELLLEEYKDTELLLDRSAAAGLQELLDQAQKATGDKVYLMSTYRTWEEQEEEYRNDPKLAAPAGASEHQTGLAIDLYVYQKAQREFITSKAGVWIQEHAHEYGFIIRYPFGKESVTGIAYEPWHIRYVGKPHAALMYANRWTLEEYVERLDPGRFYSAGGYAFTRQLPQDGALSVPADWENVTVSADNTGAYILTGEL